MFASQHLHSWPLVKWPLTWAVMSQPLPSSERMLALARLSLGKLVTAVCLSVCADLFACSIGEPSCGMRRMLTALLLWEQVPTHPCSSMWG